MEQVFKPGIKRSWFNLAYEEGMDTAEAYIYDDIGQFGVRAKDFIEEVNTLGAKNLNVYINSYGGEIDEGVAIYNFLNRFAGQVTIRVDGIAASIASIIAMAGDKVIMPKASLMFIHNPWTMAAGDANSLQKEAEQLEKRKSALMAIYADKTGLPSDFLSKMMDDETLLNADEAVAMKFADEIEDAPAEGAMAFNATLYNKILSAAARKLKNGDMNMAEEIKPKDQEPEADPSAEITPDSKTEEVDPEAKAEVCPNCGKSLAEEKEDEEEMKAEEMPEEKEKEVAKEDEEKYDARAEFKVFVDAFGIDRAGNYFSAGLSVDEAKAAYVAELAKENADLKAKLASGQSVKPVAVKPSDTSDSPVMFTRDQIRRMSAEEYRKNRNEINKAQAEGRIK